MITLTNIHKRHAGRVVVDRASLHVSAGSGLCLHGPSGCGKTTLLEIAAGIATPDAGQVHLSTRQKACAFQDDALIPWLNAQDNVTYALRGSKRQRLEQARHWLDYFELRSDQRPTTMSGGQRRRLGLARALAADAPVLFLDEPLAFLDERWHKALTKALNQRLDNGTAILAVSHQMEPLEDLNITAVCVPKPPINIDFRQ